MALKAIRRAVSRQDIETLMGELHRLRFQQERGLDGYPIYTGDGRLHAIRMGLIDELIEYLQERPLS